MRYRKMPQRILSALLVSIIFFDASSAQVAPFARVEKIEVRALKDSDGNPREFKIEFLVQANFVVGYVTLFYRNKANEEYKWVELERDPDLLYVGKLPRSSRIEYYLKITPESGSDVSIYSPTEPGVLEPPLLPKVEASGKKKRGWVGWLVLILALAGLALLGGGAGAKK